MNGLTLKSIDARKTENENRNRTPYLILNTMAPQKNKIQAQEGTLADVEEECRQKITSKKNPHSGEKRKAKESSRNSISIAEM